MTDASLPFLRPRKNLPLPGRRRPRRAAADLAAGEEPRPAARHGAAAAAGLSWRDNEFAELLAVRLRPALFALDQGRQAEKLRPKPPFGLHLAVVARFEQRDAEIGIAVSELDFVGKALPFEPAQAQHDAAIGARGERNLHPDAGDAARDLHAPPREHDFAPPPVGARIGRDDPA